MLNVGLTGNIGSGKSLVGRMFRTLGIAVFDADLEARRLYSLEKVKQELTKIAGEDILNSAGEVDRKKLASILFRESEKLRQVNKLIHPLVRNAFAELGGQGPDAPYIVYEAAILVESGYYKELDKLIVVHAPEDLRLRRVMQRDGATEAEVRARMRNQAGDEEKIRVADFVVYNDGSRLVIPQVLEIDKALRA